uniref:START domain-containing protein n=1 Tax=Globisporangium ultimum (strain ATCC 200006 / CBS 805.95 / DAOM BR144) TaxID=431595 RepID=K3X117_GLOUD
MKARSHALPLPVDPTTTKPFPKIELTPEEQAHYDRVVGRLLYAGVQEYTKYSSKGELDCRLWAPVRKNSDMAIFKDLRGTGDPRVTRMLGIGKVDCYLEDIMDGLYSENTQELRTVLTFLKAKFIAGSIMQVSERRTPDDRFNFAGIKWFAAKTPGGAVSYDRDMLTYERQGITFDAAGNEIGYHLLQSVDRPEWPANTFKGLIRAHMSTCYLYKRKGKQVETFFWGEFFDSGSFPTLISNFAMAGKWISVVNFVKASEARKLSQLRKRAHTRASTSSITISDICLDAVAKQRGSAIEWDGSSAPNEQPPVFFDYVFHFSGVRGPLDSELSSTYSTMLVDESTISTSYLEDASLRSNKELDVSMFDSFIRRKQSHAERLSRRSYSNEEDLLSDLFTDSMGAIGKS